jgi:hypothetical protein
MAAQTWICSAHAYAAREAVNTCTKSADDPFYDAD